MERVRQINDNTKWKADIGKCQIEKRNTSIDMQKGKQMNEKRKGIHEQKCRKEKGNAFLLKTRKTFEHGQNL